MNSCMCFFLIYPSSFHTPLFFVYFPVGLPRFAHPLPRWKFSTKSKAGRTEEADADSSSTCREGGQAPGKSGNRYPNSFPPEGGLSWQREEVAKRTGSLKEWGVFFQDSLMLWVALSSPFVPQFLALLHATPHPRSLCLKTL